MRSFLAIAAAALVITACADSPTDMPTPQFAKGGFGNAHFVTDATSCTFDQNYNGTCVYQIAGLANGAVVTITATMNVGVEYDCINNGGVIPRAWADLTGSGSTTITVVKGGNGNVSGTLNISLSAADVAEDCPAPNNGNGLQPTNVVVTDASWSFSAAGYNKRTPFSLPGISGLL